jgi:hypothetical protein
MTTIIDAAGWTLVHFLWQGAAIAAVAALGMRLLRRGSPQALRRVALPWRNAGVAAGHGTRLLSPSLRHWRRSTDLFLRVLPQGAHEVSAAIRRRPAQVSGTPAATAGPGGAGSGAAWMPTLVAAWLAGVCLLFARLAAGLWRVECAAPGASPALVVAAACDRLAGSGARAVRVAGRQLSTAPGIGWPSVVLLSRSPPS